MEYICNECGAVWDLELYNELYQLPHNDNGGNDNDNGGNILDNVVIVENEIVKCINCNTLYDFECFTEIVSDDSFGDDDNIYNQLLDI